MRGALLQQYLRIKAEHQDAILLFRLGDFYEMFFEDAQVASRALDLTLTARNRGEPDEVPLCGFPAHAAQPYVARLLAGGHTVAICEQGEARGKGIMMREVTRVVTPGTILEEESLDPRAPSLLVGVAAHGDRVGVATVDFASGSVRVTEGASWAAAAEEVERLAPRELLIPADAPAEAASALSTARPWATAVLPLGGAATASLPAAASAALAGTLAYVDRVYRRRPAHLMTPALYPLASVLALDSATRRNLELVETVGGERRGSLLWVLDRTQTPMGARRLREWVLYPLTDPLAIGARLDAVERLVEDVALRHALQETLGGMGDLERLAGRVGTRTAGPRDLAVVAASLRRVATILTHLAPEAGGPLEGVRTMLDAAPDVVDVIERTLVEAPAPHTRLPGYVREGHHPEVDELRAIAHAGKQWLTRFEADERRRTGIATLKVRYNRVFGYYVEVTKANLASVPAEWERKQTLVGAERFVTPVLKEWESKVLGAEERLRALEQHVFDGLLDQVASRHPTLARTADGLAMLDGIGALADVAHHAGWVRPQLVQAPILRVAASRHPVVEAVGATAFVPNDIDLDADGVQIVLLTGPNMGGKSTYLRQAAVLTLLAHIGSFVPASRAEVGLTDRIFTRVGASDNLVAGDSTFMVEMRETANILAGLTARSLVVLDEIGRGTSTFDGISIAWAVAEHLHEATERPRTLFATHYHELTALAESHARIRNCSVAVAEWKGEIVFLRRVVEGPAPRSYGVEVARLAGVPNSVIERARAILVRLESGEGPPTQEAPVTGAAEQLGLFPSVAEQCRRDLAALAPERMTPVDAIGVLARLVERARAGG